jgi:hypothetical protein
MRSILRKLRGPSLLPKTQRNRTVLFVIRFTKIWRIKSVSVWKSMLTPCTLCHVSVTALVRDLQKHCKYYNSYEEAQKHNDNSSRMSTSCYRGRVLICYSSALLACVLRFTDTVLLTTKRKNWRNRGSPIEVSIPASCSLQENFGMVFSKQIPTMSFINTVSTDATWSL